MASISVTKHRRRNTRCELIRNVLRCDAAPSSVFWGNYKMIFFSFILKLIVFSGKLTTHSGTPTHVASVHRLGAIAEGRHCIANARPSTPAKVENAPCPWRTADNSLVQWLVVYTRLFCTFYIIIIGLLNIYYRWFRRQVRLGYY